MEGIVFSETCLEKFVRSLGMNLISAGFSFLEPLCVRPSAVRALQQPLFLWSQMNNWTQSSSTPCLAYYMAFWPSPTSCLFCTDQRSTKAKISSFGQNEGSWNHNTGFNFIWSVNTDFDTCNILRSQLRVSPLTLGKGCKNVVNYQYCEWPQLATFLQPFLSGNLLFIKAL